MDKQEIISKLENFPYDKNDYRVITGAAMVLYGIREQTHDIDLGCTSAMADRLEAEGYLYKAAPDGRQFKIGGDIEAFENWLGDGADVVDGIPVVSIPGLLNMKRRLGREKDLRDIKLINEFLERTENKALDRIIGEGYRILPCTEEDAELIDRMIEEGMKPFAPVTDGAADEPFCLKIQDSNGNIAAGCGGEIDEWKVALLDSLWVDERFRGRGMGSALLREIENIAAQKGCGMIIVGTFSYQDKGFFDKRGFNIRTEESGWPKGHTHYMMTKNPEMNGVKSDYEILPGSKADAELLERKLEEFNEARVPSLHEYESFAMKLADADGVMLGGFTAGVNGRNVACLDEVWVDEKLRKRGLGSALVAEAEREAGARGADIMVLGTFSFQARGFYEKLGYFVTGELTDYPKGHSWFRMIKPL